MFFGFWAASATNSVGPVDRFAFQLGSFSVTWYGLCVAAGFWLGAWTAARRAPRAGIRADTVWDLLWVLIVAGIVGARVLYVATYWERDFKNEPWSEVLMVHHGGLVFHGGFVGATLAGFAWCRLKKVPGWRMADILAPGLALGHAIGRIGCLINGCCYGRRCDLPWSIRYPGSYGLPDARLHPTQVYETLLGLALAAGLAWWFGRRKFEGQVFALYLLAYAVIRSFVELFRGDYPASTITLGFLTPAHWVSLGLFGLGIILYLLLRRGPAPSAFPTPSTNSDPA